MLYDTYLAFADASGWIRSGAGLMAAALEAMPGTLRADGSVRAALAACRVTELCGLSHRRLPYGIDEIMCDGEPVPVIEEAADRTPFGTLLHFRKDGVAPQPKVLVVAPMSGHFATLLRGTVRTLLPEQDVYITDWHNARDIATDEGRFGFDEYVHHLARFLDIMGPGSHVLAVCQPCVAALATVAIMAEDRHRAQPASLTLMAGPIDTRVNPTQVNRLARSKPIEWFERNLIATVPWRFEGAFRRVYPGFLQLSAFMSMNPARHGGALFDLFLHHYQGDGTRAEAIETFYNEYLAAADLPAEFYLETVQRVFQDDDLPRGVLRVGDRVVDPRAIRRTALFTVEGERDDICAVGQTVAAQDLCSGIRPFLKHHHMQTGAGHYGVFNGRRWENEIYPRLHEIIHAGV